MTWDQPTFRRARSLTKALTGAFEATIVIIRDGHVWRSIDPKGEMIQEDAASVWVTETGKPLWIEDMSIDPRTADSQWVVEAPYLRSYAGAPIILKDGSVLGAIAAVGIETKPEVPALLARLADLAAFVSDECDAARAAEALAEGGRKLSEARTVLAALIDVVPVSILMTDTKMNVIEVSRQWTDNLGGTPDAARGRPLYALYPHLRKFKDNYDRVLAGETLNSARVKWRRDDGSHYWIRTEMTPWYDCDGKIGGLITAAVDISETVEALYRSERAEQRMNLATEIANLLVWDIDYVRGELIVGGATQSAEEGIFGRRFSYELLSQSPLHVVHPDDRERVGAEWALSMEKGEKLLPEFRVAREDDKEVWVACAAKLITGKNGEPLHLVGAMQDITERKRAEAALMLAKEEAEAANVAKSAFLATMSHEIRTPLNGVLGMAQAMSADPLEDVQRERLSIIRQSGETLLAILNDVLDLSKIEAGKLELEIADFDLDEVARGAYASFTAIANSKGLSFNLIVDEQARGVYRGDSTRLRQILYNLVSNALKFTLEGEVNVTITRPGEALVMRVVDTGLGVAPSRLSQLFEKFEQADTSTTRRYGGTGLGLSICRQLSELMGGTITVQSVENRGSTFEVILPLERVGESRGHTGATEQSNTPPAFETARLRVLAAEDNRVNQLVLQTLLHQAGIEPVIVSDGLQALQAWRQGGWDVILMDVQMPEMDGPTATRAIREEEARSGRARTPIIALTANAMAHQVSEYLACGMDDFVAKPIEISQLFAALERALEACPPSSEALAS